MAQENEKLSVSRVVDRINDIIGAAFQGKTEAPFLVEGTVKRVTDNRAKSGWYYFSLEDDKATIRCALPPELSADAPTEDSKIAVIATLNLYSSPNRQTRIELMVFEFTVVGKGDLSSQHLSIRRELQRAGIPIRHHKIPSQLQRIGIITPRASVAYDDIITALGTSARGINIERIDFDSDSIESLRSQLLIADNQKFDLLVIARGGGDGIQIFNNREAAKTIAMMNTPTITAIGHSTDITLCDLLATKHVGTPTAAGEFIRDLVQARPAWKFSKWAAIGIAAAILLILMIIWLICR